MAASLSAAEGGVLRAIRGEAAVTDGVEFTDAVRPKTIPQVTGPEFRRAVASLAERGLLRARVATKPGGEVGRVVIEDVTPLGRCVMEPLKDRAS